MKKMEKLGNIIQNPFEFDINELEKFLSKINSTINEIRKSDIKNYSLLSSIFNCFYENKTTSLPKQTIYDYIHQDVIKYKGKMIISFVSNGTNKKEIIDENNYLRKTYSIISKNKCLIQQSNNYISIDLMFIKSHKNLIYRNVFGKDEELISDNPKKNKKLKKLESPTDNLEKEYKSQDIKNTDDDFEIEIIGNEQDETETSIINNKDVSINNTQSNNTNSKTINLGIQPKKTENTYLKKKRKSIRKIREHKKDNTEEENEEKNNITNYISNNVNNKKIYNIVKDSKRYIKENKKEILEETEIKSFIEEGKLFLSLFTDKELLNELDTNNNKNNLEENNSFIK